MKKQSHFHFVGINGIGMSAIAKILHKQGHTISGCDLACDLGNIQELIDAGCKISSEHNTKICNDSSITTMVYSSDVSYQSQELINARSKGIATIQRAGILAQIMYEKKYAIGIAGSHGKTTTTAMIGHILTQAKLDPTIIVGGMMNNINNNARFGSSEYLVAETDESDKSHLLLPVKIGIVTNIDFEHANTYKNLDEVVAVFKKFIAKIPSDGKAIICLDDQNISDIIKNHSFDADIVTYGTNQKSQIQAINIRLHPENSIFDIKGYPDLSEITLHEPSIYNILNATAAITTALQLKIPHHIIKKALASFQGVDRRFTLKGIMQPIGVEIFDDYGHHPTEIYHSLITASRRTKNKLTVVFQPQRYSRTFHLWNEFVQVFANSNIDHLIITDIYTAHEPAIEGIDSQNLVKAIAQQNNAITISYVPFQKNLNDIKNKVIENLNQNDLILLLGAGKINKLADQLL